MAKKEINVELGARLRKERERQKLTREAFSEKINVSSRFLADVESGVVGVSLTTLKEICVVMGISSDYLLTLSDCEETTDKDVLINKINMLDSKYINCLTSIVNAFTDIENLIE